MSLYLAIDAGGTKSQSLLATADSASGTTRILARASTGSIKLMRVSEEEATASLRAMLKELAAAAHISLQQITRTCIGLAGLTTPAARTWALRTLPALVSGELILCGDEEIALDAAFQSCPGILVIAGTGSNVVGRSASGQIFSAGGWGPVLGDEGSGYWIGLEAIRVALRAQDRLGFGGPSSCLLRDIELHWSLSSLPELVALANQRPGPDFAALAPVVARCSGQGDALAAGILERAGQELAEQVALVFHKITAPAISHAPQPIAVAYTGSVLSHIPAVRSAMTAQLAVTLPTAHIRQTPVDPLDGALWRALHHSTA